MIKKNKNKLEEALAILGFESLSLLHVNINPLHRGMMIFVLFVLYLNLNDEPP